MYWTDEGYLLFKSNYRENSIIVEAFTLNHGKCTGIVYGGSSRKQKNNFQIGNKILLNWKSKSENKIGYFNIELIKPISPSYFDDKRKTICILSASIILKLLLPEKQINKKIFYLFEEFLFQLNSDEWIKSYISWELSLIKELGFEINFTNKKKQDNNIKRTIELNNKYFKIPKLLLSNNENNNSNIDIKEALIFNKNIMMENFILPNHLQFPLSRNILENYYN